MKYKLMRNINVIARCATLYRDENLADCGIGGYQAPYITAIKRHPGLTQDEISKHLHVNRSSVTRQLAQLEENGFILRKRSDKDKRAVEVYLTKKGENAVPIVKETFRRWREALTADLTEEQLNAAETLLEILARRAQEIE